MEFCLLNSSLIEYLFESSVSKDYLNIVRMWFEVGMGREGWQPHKSKGRAKKESYPAKVLGILYA